MAGQASLPSRCCCWLPALWRRHAAPRVIPESLSRRAGSSIHHLLHQHRWQIHLQHHVSGRASSTPGKGPSRAPRLELGHQGHVGSRLTVRRSSRWLSTKRFEVLIAPSRRSAPLHQLGGEIRQGTAGRQTGWRLCWPMVERSVSRPQTRRVSRARGSATTPDRPGEGEHTRRGDRHAASQPPRLAESLQQPLQVRPAEAGKRAIKLLMAAGIEGQQQGQQTHQQPSGRRWSPFALRATRATGSPGAEPLPGPDREQLAPGFLQATNWAASSPKAAGSSTGTSWVELMALLHQFGSQAVPTPSSDQAQAPSAQARAGGPVRGSGGAQRTGTSRPAASTRPEQES